MRYAPFISNDDSGTPNLHIRLLRTKSATTFLVTDFYEVASTHLVNKSMATKINMCPLEATSSIGQMTSIPQATNGQGDRIALSS